MRCEKTKDIAVVQISCSDDARYLPPTAAAVEAMKKSLQACGQINAIGVHPVTHNTYRVISGATRFRAASSSGWKTIRASIWVGSAADYEIHELTENADRRDVTAEQRREMRARVTELQRQRLADVEPSKGGRGKKGGLREAARQAGMPKSTAHDRQREAKLSENDDKRTVSAPDAPTPAVAPVPAPTPASAYARTKVTFELTLGDYRRLCALCDRTNISQSEMLRRFVRAGLDSAEADDDGSIPGFLQRKAAP